MPNSRSEKATISVSCSDPAALRGLAQVPPTFELTGDVDPEDFEALSERVTDEDEGQDDVNPYEAKTAEGGSLIEQLRRDGVL